MTLTKETALQDVTIHHLTKLYEEFKKDGNETQAGQIIDLLKKIKTSELVIGFSGHFSAGKSTMINQLLGEDILPSSPIPTSANIVKIKKGAGFARIYYTEEGPVDYEEPYDLESLKDFCKDGDSIYRIDIHHSALSLPDGVAIIDTPGIDSANDADRVMTESNMHVIDILFYVMDYNHVQSEVNLSFLLEMTRKKKPIYIVVNQIDKHQDHELSFESFKSSLMETLQKWNISYEGIFFTTLKQAGHPYNEYEALKTKIHQLFETKDQWIRPTIANAARSLIEDHIKHYEQSFEKEINQLSDQIQSLKADQTNDQNVKELQDAIRKLKETGEKLELEFREELQNMLKNAYLMPFDVREQAKHYLESMQQGFKVGLFFSGKKTAEEQKRRLDEFYQSLVKQAESQIQWHIRDWFVQKSKEFQIYDDTFSKQIQQFAVVYDKERLKQLVKSGAQVTGDYVLVYTNDVADDIKNVYRSAARHLLDKLLTIVEAQNQNSLKEKEQELAREIEAERYQKRLEQMEQELKNKNEKLHNLLSKDITLSGEEIKLMEAVINEQEHNAKKGTWEVKEKRLENHSENTGKISVEEMDNHSLTAEEMVARLKQAEELMNGLNSFPSLVADLKDKRERLVHKHFTVALFGAFSAGKSSFANALLGKSILPVSPNPTTAAINKISPPDSEHPDQSARVTLKTENDLWDDLKLAMDHIPDSVTCIEELHAWLEKTDPVRAVKNHEHVHLSFLQAFVKGYPKMRPYIGKEIQVSLTESRSYIADEEKACFVESIELYYDCELTRNNMTLVDTPGADSIHARHTDVSFEYIKNSDAILFVTYYNHPFSRADREFLKQLGRVKDVFTLDKMFFLVNAADLAEHEDDLNLVLSYVEEQLAIHGIRSPRIYPVSSKWALEGKRGDETRLHASNINTFEQSFYEFIQKDLTGLFIQSAMHDVQRTYQTLTQFIQSASLDEREKVQRRIVYQENLSLITETITQFSADSYEGLVKHELKELVYYIKQRLFLGFSDLFKESFHPSVIQSAGKKGREEVAVACEELLGHMKKQIIQELQATTLRLERFIIQKLADMSEELLKKIQEVDHSLSFSGMNEPDFQPITFQAILENVQGNTFKRIFRFYKNPKTFFEENEKEVMKEELKKELEPYVIAELDREGERLTEHYVQEWQQKVEELKNQRIYEVQEYVNTLLKSLSEQIDVAELKDKKKKFEQLILS